MLRVVYIGGFSAGKASVEKVCEALSKFYEDVYPVTFSTYWRFLADYDAIKPELPLATKDAALITHSAGALALELSLLRPKEAYLLNPPLPRNLGRLAVGAVVKTVRMHVPGCGIRTFGELPEILRHDADSVIELVSHPADNVAALRRISRFNAIISAAVARQKRSLPVRAVWTEDDVFFKPSKLELNRAKVLKVPVTILPGEHDEVVLRPDEFLYGAFNNQDG